ncbi:hypothetical protein [Janthinobacterium sp. BJB426]|uniref:hypothetical protein n=1 Tax=Janthinobacterium sp. BJB426 TaxID=2048010 RepID=UPI00130542F5|nr:hypothetical protein [Janthinobacterium sp. BJB426]
MIKYLAISMVFFTGIASAQVHVNGYTKKDGTYVAPHQRTAPDSTISNNYSTQGNVNPYTGKAGTVPNQADSSYGYQPQAKPAPRQEFQPLQPLPSFQPTQPLPQPPVWGTQK